MSNRIEEKHLSRIQDKFLWGVFLIILGVLLTLIINSTSQPNKKDYAAEQLKVESDLFSLETGKLALGPFVIIIGTVIALLNSMGKVQKRTVKTLPNGEKEVTEIIFSGKPKKEQLPKE